MRRARGWVAASLLAGAAFIAGAAAGRTRPPAAHAEALPQAMPAPAAPLALGKELYDLHCSSCHGAQGDGTSEGVPLRGIGPGPVDFMLSTGRMPLRAPNQPTLRQSPLFSTAQIAAIVDYVASFAPGGVPIPTVNPARGDLVRGAQLFSANCAPCHGADGQGAAVGHGAVAPGLHDIPPLQVAEAIRTGPPPMPQFGPEVFGQHDLDSLVRYVTALRSIPDRGGFGLGHEGPVIEGFIAWLVGLGALVLVTRMIGTTV
jgi:ubiquinol-cytochrome c reductase cytochrome c subunit